jgi:hypothetical protein
LDQKLDAISAAGFDGVCWAPNAQLWSGAQQRGLIFVGGMVSGTLANFPSLLNDLSRYGARHVNVQLVLDDVLTPEAVQLAVELVRQARELGLEPAIETHRGTCTETPEKLYALADAYEQQTGELLPISWDFSHYAVVKHLVPENFAERLLIRPDLIQRSQQFHFRPFNGHHAQVPITDGQGALTHEVVDWLPFAEAILECWLRTNWRQERELFICPELGPIVGGYALSSFPNSWEEVLALREVVNGLWSKVTSSAASREQSLLDDESSSGSVPSFA